MSAVRLALAGLLLVACNAPHDLGAAPDGGAQDSGVMDAAIVLDTPPAVPVCAEAPPPPKLPPPPGERVWQPYDRINLASRDWPPQVLVGRPPSAEFPEGTVFVSAAISLNLAPAKQSPLVFEWDIANAKVLADWLDPRGEMLMAFAHIAYDGDRIYLLTEWSPTELESARGQHDTECRLDVLDARLNRVKTQRVACGDALAAGRNGSVLIGNYQHLPTLEPLYRVILHTYDAALKAGPTMRFRVPTPPPLSMLPRLHHAGDSYYLTIESRGVNRVVRLDDQTLREVARSPAVGAAGNVTALLRSDRGWVVGSSEARWEVSPLLETALAHEKSVLDEFDVAWSEGRRIAQFSMPKGSAATGGNCTPIWAHGQALFACVNGPFLELVSPDPATVL